jgi:hypothetical protein
MNDYVGYTQGLEMSEAYDVNKDDGTVSIDFQEGPPTVEITSEPLPRYDTSRSTSTSNSGICPNQEFVNATSHAINPLFTSNRDNGVPRSPQPNGLYQNLKVTSSSI